MGGVHDEALWTDDSGLCLHRNGRNFLVISDGHGGPSACNRLNGGTDRDYHTVFLSTMPDLSEILERHRPRSTDPSKFGVIDIPPSVRGGVAGPAQPGSATTPTGSWYTRIDELSSMEVLAEVETHFERVSADAPAGKFRFCLDSLEPLVEAFDTEELYDFIDSINGLVRDADGLGHAHVSPFLNPADMEPVLEKYDALIKLRQTRTGAVEQRWCFTGSVDTTDWFPLE